MNGIGNVTLRNSASLYRCPTKGCTKLMPSYLKRFRYNHIDNIIKCIFCKRQSIACNWRCECGLKWHACPIHGKGYDQNVLNKPKSKAKAKPEAKSSAACMPRTGNSLPRNSPLGNLAQRLGVRHWATYSPRSSSETPEMLCQPPSEVLYPSFF